MTRHYYIFRSVPGDEGDIINLQMSLDGLEDQGLSFNFPLPEKISKVVIEYHWIEQHQRVGVTLVDDYSLRLRYLIIESSSLEDIATVNNWLEEDFSFVSIEELEEKARLHMADEPELLVRLAFGGAEAHTPTVFAVLQEGLHHHDAAVRQQAALAAGLLQWPEFVADLRVQWEQEQDTGVREMLGKAIQACGEIAPA